MKKIITIKEIENFWNKNPLFFGEIPEDVNQKDFFEKIDLLYLSDIFPGKVDPRMLPDKNHLDGVLDLGCGPGCWTVQLAKHGAKNITAADLTQSALDLAREHCKIYGYEVATSKQNAEKMTFQDQTFSHVFCSGVIHHTPDTQECIKEIARVLKPEGTALISVYYKNIYLRGWPYLRHVARLFHKMGAKLQGRGREDIYRIENVEELVRFFDGKDNPVGKVYSKKQFLKMLEPYFIIEKTFLHYFPARSLPFKIPQWLHKILDRYTGFLLFAQCKKR